MKTAGVSFRTMLLAMIAAVVVPLAALLPLGIHQAFESRSELAREGVRHLASTAAVAIDQAFADMRRSFEAAARLYDPEAASQGDCARFIATVKALQPNAANVAYGDRRGIVSCSVAPLPADRKLDFRQFSEFQKPLNEGVTIIGEPMVSPITGLAQVLLATPVRDRGGQIAGVLAMAIQLDVVRRLAASAVRDGRTTLSVITPGGVLIAHAPEGGGRAGRNVADPPADRAILDSVAPPGDGMERLVGVAPVASTGWSVVAALPREEALAPVYRGVSLSLGFAVCVILAAAALAALVARRLSRPVDGIVSAMQLASAGAAEARAPEGGPREIALIGAEFNRMIAARTRLEAERHAALERAAAHERRLREVIETLAEGLVIIGADGRYELVNRAEEELLGVPRERLLGVRFDAAPFGRAATGGTPFRIEDHPFEQLRRGQAPIRDFELQLVQPSGQARTVLANAAPLRDAAGNFDGIVATCVDITERKAGEARIAEYSAKLAALSRRVLTVQEEERRAVARELHDEFGQLLTAIKVNLQALHRQAAARELVPRIEDNLRLLDGAIAEVRAIATRLRPSVLDDLGLEAALRSYLDRIRARGAVELAADVRLPQPRLDPAVETACFRIVQEAVTNALRHAHATALRVGLGVENGELALSVRDDGGGFDLTAAGRRAAQGESAGLSGMEERARLAGGRLEVDTSPGRGTEVRATFPLASASS